MGIFQLFDNISKYIFGAVGRIFSPSDDAYPETGVQPFSGDPFQDKEGENW
ncbi:hypothetical protein [Lyngbya aestuarii]|uniref:hypothetical protein n=1 Tax=Lyngbya aestuarii TaxID=118322 RepID=UPI00403DAC7F